MFVDVGPFLALFLANESTLKLTNKLLLSNFSRHTILCVCVNILSHSFLSIMNYSSILHIIINIIAMNNNMCFPLFCYFIIIIIIGLHL